jgi:hypothetical protein
MGKFIDLTGLKFGRWTILKQINTNKKKSRWKCECSCGIIKNIDGYSLRTGDSKSCGCLHKDIMTKHGLSNSHIDKIWKSMIQRCTNPKNPRYKDYGNRGITVCKRWLPKNNGFINFLNDMGLPPSKKHQIDRIDNNKGYHKKNCRWSTNKENNYNRRDSHMLTYKGKTQCIAAWAEEYNLPYDTLRTRIRRGWNIDRALNEPIRRKIK